MENTYQTSFFLFSKLLKYCAWHQFLKTSKYKFEEQKTKTHSPNIALTTQILSMHGGQD